MIYYKDFKKGEFNMEILIAFAGYLGVSVAQLIGFLGVLSAGAIIPNLKCLGGNRKGLSTLSDIKHLLDKDNFLISKNVSISFKNLFEHSVIIGPTGAGKSTTIFIPNLLKVNSFNNSNSSIVATDPKGELYDLTANYQRSIGRDVKVFSPYSSAGSIHYNPLDFCKNKSEVIALARDILVSGNKAMELRSGGGGNKDSVWLNMATPLFAAVLLYVYKLGKPHNTISNALRILVNKDEDSLKELLVNEKDKDIEFQYKMYEKCITSPATSGSIQITLVSNVQSFLTPDLEKITAYSDFDFEDLRRKKTILYLIYPVEKAYDLAPITSVFFDQLFNKCKALNKEEHLPIICLFEEFSNVGIIPNFNIHAATLRSFKIALLICLQDKNQLKTLYGAHAETIFNNLKNLVLFGGAKDIETLRTISVLCGKEDVLNISTSNNNKGNTSTTKSFKSTEVMQISDLKNISENEVFIMLKNQKPLLDSVNPYYKDYDYMNNIM